MRKVYLAKGLVMMTLGIIVASCSKSEFYTQQAKVDEFTDNFQTILMNGQEVDPNQTWSTASTIPVQVAVDLDYGEEYTVYFFTTPPLLNDSISYIGCGKVKSGETTTVNVTTPNGAMTIYAALYDKDSHAICKPFTLNGLNSKVEFSNKETTSSNVRGRANTTGNRWSVEVKSMPDLSAYTTGTTAINSSNNTANSSIRKFSIPEGKSWSNNIPLLQSGSDVSLYVEGTFNIEDDQKVNGGCAIVVGSTGVINVKRNETLSTNANNNTGTTGMIYVMPGGIIQGNGTLEFSNGTETYSYNAGEITVKKININGGTLYNAGTLGKSKNNPQTELEGPGGTPEQPSLLVNMGQAYFTEVSGAGMAIYNACNIYVSGNLALGNSSKMDDGSYIECGSLSLNGSNNGGIVLYMGNAAYMKCNGNLSVNNFGVWGPTSNNGGSINRAIFKINYCNYCNYTSGDASTFLLDNVELILPWFYPTGVDWGYDGSSANIAYDLGYLDANTWPLNVNYNAKLLLYGWYNGYACRLINGDNYDFQQVYVRTVVVNPYYQYDVYEWVPVWKEGYSLTSFDDDSRATCIYGTSPSYSVKKDKSDNCGVDFTKESDDTPSPNYIYYAFEDLGTTDDFDFNDVVIRVSTPDADGMSTVELVAAGGTLAATVTYGTDDEKRDLGGDVHDEFGVTSRTMVNTGYGSFYEFVNLGTIEVGEDADLTNLPLGINVSGNGSQIVRVTESVENNGKAPLVIVTSGYPSGGNAGKWFWPTERTMISTAYTDFGNWGANANDYKDWYLNYTEDKVYQW